MNKGRFIVFEGIDGSGKGTQIDLLVSEMKKRGRQVYQTAEPTSSATGGLIRDALGGLQKRDAYELSALFLTDRIFHNVNEVNGIKQFLEKGTDVVCDRYYYSSFAYQGIDADLKWVMELNLGCQEILRPDLCIFLDADADACDERIENNRFEREIYENLSAQKKIRKRFLEVFEMLKDRENIQIINGTGKIDQVAKEVLAVYDSVFGGKDR